MSAHDGTMVAAFAIALEGECDPRRDVERGARLVALLEAMSKDQLDAIRAACEQLDDQAGAARIRVYGFDPMPAEPQPYEDPRARLRADRMGGSVGMSDPRHQMRFTVRPVGDDLLRVHLWMAPADTADNLSDLKPVGHNDMTLSQFVFYRQQILLSSTVSIIYEPGLKARIDAVERAEYGGRAALQLLAAHGGPDFLVVEPAGDN